MSTRDLAMRALIVKHVADVAAAAIKDRRDDLTDELASGDRVTVTSPDDPDLELGQVWRTKPKGSGVITNRAALTDWLAATYPDRVQTTTTIAPGKEVEAVAVLAEHAPELLDTSTQITAWAETEILRCTQHAKQACGPGGELDIPGVMYQPPGPGVVTVKLSDDGPAVIEHLWREGRIDLRSGAVRALPAGEA